MVYKVTFRPETEKDFKKLDRQIAQRIIRKIKWLSKNFQLIIPTPLHKELIGKYKLRVGNYRIVYSVIENEKRITIHMVGHRREIYK